MGAAVCDLFVETGMLQVAFGVLTEKPVACKQIVRVAKAGGSEHQFVTREFKIGPGGISLVPIEEGKALPMLPFNSYYGLLSRAPTRHSPDLPRGGGGAANAEAT